MQPCISYCSRTIFISRSALKVAEVDLASARSHVQQFQEISQANEAALASLNATYDEYKSVTEAQIATHEACRVLCTTKPYAHIKFLSLKIKLSSRNCKPPKGSLFK